MSPEIFSSHLIRVRACWKRSGGGQLGSKKLLLRRDQPGGDRAGLSRVLNHFRCWAARSMREARKRAGRSLHPPGGSRICRRLWLEISGLHNPYYDLERFGLQFVTAASRGCRRYRSRDAAWRIIEADCDAAGPKIVIAVGDCAERDFFAGGTQRGWAGVGCHPVDVVVPGCPRIHARFWRS